METENQEVEEKDENLELPPDPKEGEEDTTNWKEEALKLRDKAISQRERTKAIKQELKKAKDAVDVITASKKEPIPAKTGELDETTLDYLDLKGINEAEDIKIVEDVVKKTGMTVRQVLKDEYVQTKLTANKAKREVKDATPSRTNRGGSQQSDVAAEIAKFEQTGKLPDDFALKSAVINAIVDKANTNKPSWH
jgi:hypothetical protein